MAMSICGGSDMQGWTECLSARFHAVASSRRFVDHYEMLEPKVSAPMVAFGKAFGVWPVRE